MNVLCDNTTLVAGEQDSLGFECHNGPLVVTDIKDASSARRQMPVGVVMGIVGMVLSFWLLS